MFLSTSPRKTVPLASGDDSVPGALSSKPVVTKRIFFCGVVVEKGEDAELSEDVQDLVSSFGEPFGFSDEEDLVSSTDRSTGTSTDNDSRARRRAMTNTSAIQDVINELVSTERSYVKRLRILKHDYADPLRVYARAKQTAIIPAYEANTLFGNIDALLPINEAFLDDLEQMVAPNGAISTANIGDVVLKHFKQQPGRGFELYKHFYVKREEAQTIFEREMTKKSSFATFIDRIKYSSGDARNRIGLRELLMEPVQRIPRYTLMFRTMIKRMAPSDPQRARLIEADEIASKIALAEADEPTKRASVMHCLTQTVEGFPPGLISHSRRLIDCIDVDDGSDSLQSLSAANALEPLRCTLFLFDDKLLIVKRPAEKSGHALSGLDRLEKASKSSGLLSGLKKNVLSYRGVVDLSEVVATSLDGAEFHLYLESPPQDQPDRWSDRAFRSLSVVHPPSPPSFNPQRTTLDKTRFLENLWKAQVDLRARSGNSMTLHAEEQEVEARGSRVTIARTYFHIYERRAFLKEAKKTKAVVHIDSSGLADPLPFGVGGPPYVVIRVQPIEGDLSRYKVTSSDPSDENEEDIVQSIRVPERVIQTIHQYGLFKFRTGKNSIPSTPTASSRSRAGIFGLDAISRNLFGALPGSSKGEFGNSLSSSRRSKSTTRSSVYTQGSDGSLMRFSQRSMMTGSTSMTSVDDESFSSNKSSSRSRKLLKKRSQSPLTAGSESGARSRSQSRARSMSREPSPAPAEDEDEGTLLAHGAYADESEWDLTQRLELARRNSQNQHNEERPLPTPWEPPEDTIYEEMPPAAVRPPSRASTATAAYSQRSTTPQPPTRATTPNTFLESPVRSSSRASGHPRGPRSPSPRPPSCTSQRAPSPLPPLDTSNVEHALEMEIERVQSPPPLPLPPAPAPSLPLPLPLGTTSGSAPHTPPPPPRRGVRQTEPLSIRKRDSVNGGPSPRKAYSKTSPLTKGRVVSPRRVSPLIRQAKTKLPAAADVDVDADKLVAKGKTARDELESARRAVKRIKTDSERLRSSLSTSDPFQAHYTPRGLPRTPQHQRAATAPASKAQEDRLAEMREAIGRRMGGAADRATPTRTPFGAPLTPSSSSSSLGSGSGFGSGSGSGSGSFGGSGFGSGGDADELTRMLADAASEADRHLLRAAAAQDELGIDLALLAADLKEKTALLERTRIELLNHKRQRGVMKDLLDDVHAEKALIYDAVNEELGKLFEAAQLPETDAWAGLIVDVRKTKDERNQLALENSKLKRQLAEVESDKDAWGAILRTHGLLPAP